MITVKDKIDGELDRKFDESRIERTIEKMFEKGGTPTKEGYKDLIKPIADKIIDGFDTSRNIKESGILKAIEREIEKGVKDGIYPKEVYKGMIHILNEKGYYGR